MTHSDPALRNDEDVAVAALANAVGVELAPTVAAHDREGSFPHEHFKRLHRAGALALSIPRALGGGGLGLYRTLLFQQHLGRHAGPTALCLGWHLMAFGCLFHRRSWPQETLERLARDVVEGGHLINVLVTERDHGNLLRGARPATRARRSGAGWVLSGRKAFCSAAPALQQMVVYASLDGEDGMAEFLVPRSERVRIVECWDTLGMRATASHDIVFDEVPLPAAALVHRFGGAVPSAFAVGSRAWGLQMPALYLGIAEAARDVAVGFARDYHAASLGGPVLHAPAVQQRLGEIELCIGAARAQLYGVAERWERHTALQERLQDEVAITKVMVGRHAVRAVELAIEIVGGHSLSRGQPLERLWRDVRCHAFNPPQADSVIAGLAKTATDAAHATDAQAA